MDTILKSSAKGDYQRACGEFLLQKFTSIKKETRHTCTSPTLGSLHGCGIDLDSKSNPSIEHADNLREKCTGCDNERLPVSDNLQKSDEFLRNPPAIQENLCKNLTCAKKSRADPQCFNRSSCAAKAKPGELSDHVTMRTEVSLIGDSGEIELTQVCCHDNHPCKPDVKGNEWLTLDAKLEAESEIAGITRPLEYYKVSWKMLCCENRL